MGRPNRIQFAGACYHVLLQGNNRQDIFLSNQDRRYFLSLLKGYKERYELQVFAYCLMPNMVHLLLSTGQPNLSKVMQGFNTAYTKYFNQQHNTIGHVFQGRYRALLVDKENYLPEVSRYVHLAPLRAGMKEKPWRYMWSSCQAYVEGGQREPIVDSAEILGRFAKVRLKQSVKYLHYIKERIKEAEAEPPTVRGVFVGTPAFAEAMSRQAGLAPTAPARGIDPQEIIKDVVDRHGIDQETLLGRSQWREVTTVRKEAIYRLWKEAKVGVTEIGRIFNRTPSAVSQLIRSVEVSRVSEN